MTKKQVNAEMTAITILIVVSFALSLIGIAQSHFSAIHNKEKAEYYEKIIAQLTDEISRFTEKGTQQETAFPVVVYKRPGLLTSEQKEQIEDHFISPMKLFYQGKEDAPVSVIITVPESLGERYEVHTIYKDGTNSGWLYGIHGDVLEYWTPPCAEGELGCEFSDEFRALYPHIIENVEAP